MKPSLLLAFISAIWLAIGGTSCNTVDDPSPFIQKERENSDIGKIKPRQRRVRGY